MEQRTNLRPGYNEAEEISGINVKVITKYVDKIIPFIRKEGTFSTGLIGDVGPENPKINLIGEKLGFVAIQILADDFNFDKLSFKQKFDIVFCFEVVEHLQNPLYFMSELKNIIKDTGSIILSTPSNPRFMWPEYHFNEMTKKRFEKWILTPLNLKIVKYKRFNFVADWRAIFIGGRPLFRIITGKTSIKEVVRGFFQIHNLYEIQKTL
jgi:SAM-dependent methyltransferase